MRELQADPSPPRARRNLPPQLCLRHPVNYPTAQTSVASCAPPILSPATIKQSYLYDLATDTARKPTSDPADQSLPRIDGTKIVWTDARHGNWDIYLYDLMTGWEHRITAD